MSNSMSEKLKEFQKNIDLEKSLKEKPGLFKLPHPKRVSLSNFPKIVSLSYEGIEDLVGDFLRRIDGTTASMQIVAGDNPRARQVLTNIFSGEFSTNNPIIHTYTTYQRWVHNKGPIITIDPGLYEILEETDISDTIPASYFHPPFRSSFIEFPLANSIRMHDPQSGEHAFEGLYISEISTVARSTLYDFLGANQSDCRHYEIMLMARPTDGDFKPKKDGILDDTFFYTDFVIPNDTSMSVMELLGKHIEFYRGEDKVFSSDGSRPHTAHSKVLEQVMEVTAKLLVFMNSSHYRKEFQNPEAEALKALERVKSPGKRKKQERKIQPLYDRIYITSNAGSFGEGSGGETSVRRKAHWRRGHMRRQPYGPRDNAEYKIVFIPPILINAGEVTAETKNYTVKV